jgi:hypothetical protein
MHKKSRRRIHAKLDPEYESLMQPELEGLWNGTYQNSSQATLAEDELVPSIMLRAEARKRPFDVDSMAQFIISKPMVDQRRSKMVCDISDICEVVVICEVLVNDSTQQHQAHIYAIG